MSDHKSNGTSDTPAPAPTSPTEPTQYAADKPDDTRTWAERQSTYDHDRLIKGRAQEAIMRVAGNANMNCVTDATAVLNDLEAYLMDRVIDVINGVVRHRVDSRLDKVTDALMKMSRDIDSHHVTKDVEYRRRVREFEQEFDSRFNTQLVGLANRITSMEQEELRRYENTERARRSLEAHVMELAEKVRVIEERSTERTEQDFVTESNRRYRASIDAQVQKIENERAARADMADYEAERNKNRLRDIKDADRIIRERAGDWVVDPDAKYVPIHEAYEPPTDEERDKAYIGPAWVKPAPFMKPALVKAVKDFKAKMDADTERAIRLREGAWAVDHASAPQDFKADLSKQKEEINQATIGKAPAVDETLQKVKQRLRDQWSKLVASKPAPSPAPAPTPSPALLASIPAWMCGRGECGVCKTLNRRPGLCSLSGYDRDAPDEPSKGDGTDGMASKEPVKMTCSECANLHDRYTALMAECDRLRHTYAKLDIRTDFAPVITRHQDRCTIHMRGSLHNNVYGHLVRGTFGKTPALIGEINISDITEFVPLNREEWTRIRDRFTLAARPGLEQAETSNAARAEDGDHKAVAPQREKGASPPCEGCDGCSPDKVEPHPADV